MTLTIGSLFSGYGGLDLAVESGLRTLGQRSRIVWQAEKDPYCCAVLRKHWPRVRCYEDVHAIDDTAPPVDLLCGGFPCQDISIAGDRLGLTGARSGLWYEFVRVIRVLRPRLVFVENVPELAAHLGAVLGPLAELGYDAEWDLFDAAAVGAPHRRERIFILAYAPHLRREVGVRGGTRAQHAPAARPRGTGPLAANANSVGLDEQSQRVGRRAGAFDAGRDGEVGALADADGSGRARRIEVEARTDPRHRARPQAGTEPAGFGGWATEPDVGRVVDGTSSRLDARRRRSRIRCLGNGVVPQQGALAFVTLAQRAGLAFTEAQ